MPRRTNKITYKGVVLKLHTNIRKHKFAISKIQREKYLNMKITPQEHKVNIWGQIQYYIKKNERKYIKKEIIETYNHHRVNYELKGESLIFFV